MTLMPVDKVRIHRMSREINEIELLGESDFLKLEYDLVAHYRRFADDQEWIAVELARKNMSVGTSLARQRLTEILAMLDHVHDPFIAAVN